MKRIWAQWIKELVQNGSPLNPLRRYIMIVQKILLKGVGLPILWPHMVALLGFCIVLLWVSIRQFRKQLG